MNTSQELENRLLLCRELFISRKGAIAMIFAVGLGSIGTAAMLGLTGLGAAVDITTRMSIIETREDSQSELLRELNAKMDNVEVTVTRIQAKLGGD